MTRCLDSAAIDGDGAAINVASFIIECKEWRTAFRGGKIAYKGGSYRTGHTITFCIVVAATDTRTVITAFGPDVATIDGDGAAIAPVSSTYGRTGSSTIAISYCMDITAIDGDSAAIAVTCSTDACTFTSCMGIDVTAMDDNGADAFAIIAANACMVTFFLTINHQLTCIV